MSETNQTWGIAIAVGCMVLARDGYIVAPAPYSGLIFY
jgi:hypothetical protein